MTAPHPHPLWPWWQDALDYRFGIVKKRPADVPHITRRNYPWALEEFARIDEWLHWFRGHKAGTRPPVWEKVPDYAWRVERLTRHRPPKPPPKPPPPPSPPPVPASWSLPGPLVETASDPGSAYQLKRGTVGRIIVEGVCPLWECIPVGGGGRGLLCQVEGEAQGDVAVGLIEEHRQPGDHLACVSTLNSPNAAAKLIKIGVTVCFFELNAQSAWEPYGNIARLDYQAMQDGWPHRRPNFGCYGAVGLPDYEAYIPLVWDTATSGWVRGDRPQGKPSDECGVFSAEGSEDSGSWPAILSL